MARQRKGRNISGWVVIDKPSGPSSSAVVNKVRWAFDAKKAGHAGTLDPEATGVLAIALGEATKTIPFVAESLKAYEFTVRFGEATTTDDAEGETLKTSDLRPSDEAVGLAVARFEGHIFQTPPAFSAVKVDGQRAYKMARAGADFELEPRPLFVDELRVLDRPDQDHIILSMVCGKGGYVRSIARDLGEELNCFAHVLALRRIWSGPFRLEGAVTLDEIEDCAKKPEINEHLLPLSVGLSEVPEASVSVESAARILNGNPGIVTQVDAEFGDIVWASRKGEPIAVGYYKAGEFHPTRVFRL